MFFLQITDSDYSIGRIADDFDSLKATILSKFDEWDRDSEEFNDDESFCWHRIARKIREAKDIDAIENILYSQNSDKIFNLVRFIGDSDILLEF